MDGNGCPKLLIEMDVQFFLTTLVVMVLFLIGGWCARACVCVCVRACVPSALSAIYSCGNFSKVDFKIAWRRRPKEIVRGDSRLKGNMYYDDFPQTRRRYTNFPNKGNYIGSDFPGQPKILFARMVPQQVPPPHVIEKNAKF